MKTSPHFASPHIFPSSSLRLDNKKPHWKSAMGLSRIRRPPARPCVTSHSTCQLLHWGNASGAAAGSTSALTTDICRPGTCVAGTAVLDVYSRMVSVGIFFLGNETENSEKMKRVMSLTVAILQCRFSCRYGITSVWPRLGKQPSLSLASKAVVSGTVPVTCRPPIMPLMSLAANMPWMPTRLASKGH